MTLAGCASVSGVQLVDAVSKNCVDLGMVSVVAKTEKSGILGLKDKVKRLGGNTLVEYKSPVISFVTHVGTEFSGYAYRCTNRNT